MFNALQKLRLCATTAYAKMVLRSTDTRPGKWDPNGYTTGMRDWRACSFDFLKHKLREESDELYDAIDQGESIDAVRKEAGDVVAVAMMLADRYGAFGIGLNNRSPTVVCLCGSTKFKDEFIQHNFQESMKGKIVLSVGFYWHYDKVGPGNHILRDREKIMLDELHKRKIDLADEILVINVGGYVGESTRSEIKYALSTGKTVIWAYPDKIPEGF